VITGITNKYYFGNRYIPSGYLSVIIPGITASYIACN